jgi:hypothetical protein
MCNVLFWNGFFWWGLRGSDFVVDLKLDEVSIPDTNKIRKFKHFVANFLSMLFLWKCLLCREFVDHFFLLGIWGCLWIMVSFCFELFAYLICNEKTVKFKQFYRNLSIMMRNSPASYAIFQSWQVFQNWLFLQYLKFRQFLIKKTLRSY